MIDVLLYLFENYVGMTAELLEENTLTTELSKAGFDKPDIQNALLWLGGIHALQTSLSTSILTSKTLAIRHYTLAETLKLSKTSRGFLLFMENLGILTPSIREVVIDRAMVLEADCIDILQMQWIILMVLFSQPQHDLAFEWIQYFIQKGMGVTSRPH